jgi:phospholipid/cholesterol/gamma-HCH transport system permease protein
MFEFDAKVGSLRLHLPEKLTLKTVWQLQEEFIKFTKKTPLSCSIDFQFVGEIDSAGALFLKRVQENLQTQGVKVSLVGISPQMQENLAAIQTKIKRVAPLPQQKNSFLTTLEFIGKEAVKGYISLKLFLTFFGEVSYALFYTLSHPHKLRYKEIFFEVNENIIKAIGIIVLTSFLVGVVVAYQSAVQLQRYGADVFIVQMLGLSIFRELGPLITAIVVAGRSGSAFTAQIGAMKVTEELDAMRVMGFDPIFFLVLPRIIALVVMMPLLIFLADVSGIIGGIIVVKYELSFSTTFFLERFVEAVPVRHFVVGIVKGPFFAFLIAAIAVFRGMQVRNDTQSIGFNTTKSVVEAIFAVIVCDAIFSIIFTYLGV